LPDYPLHNNLTRHLIIYTNIDYFMKKALLFLSFLLSLQVGAARETMTEIIERGLTLSRSQSLILAKSLASAEGRLPFSYEQGKVNSSSYQGWCAGFFPGVLWQLYGDSADDALRRYAERFTERCEPAKAMTDTHDLGFMLYCSFGQGYRLTGNPHYLDVIREGSRSLLTRYDEKLGVMKSWEPNAKWKYPVIIDNMMNLEMLCFLSHETGDRQYARAAETHANTTIKNHFREDYSTYHVVSYDPATGKPHAKQTSQGFSDGSSWARGQAWGLYGYTMMYRETLNPRYLEQARHIANFICSHPRLPDDGIPYWDFDAENIPEAVRDASAGAIMASAFIELSQLDPTTDASRWLNMAEKQLRTLSSHTYLARKGELGGFILKHSVGSLPAKREVDVPLVYADYYYVEALLRMKRLLAQPSPQTDRSEWVNALLKIAMPIVQNLAEGTLKKNFPFESLTTNPDSRDVHYLEAVGRTLCGITPWLELGADETEEGRLRGRMIDLVVRGLKNAADSLSPDYLRFTHERSRQPLVDAAFLAEGLLRSPKQVWGRLDEATRQSLIREFKASRAIKPGESNWLLFASIIEAALLEFDGQYDKERMMYGVEKFLDNWYKGDAWYGDGPNLALDYYNSLVIQPMLTEVLMVCEKHGLKHADRLKTQQARMGRHAEQLERMISPEGAYPVIGRSITYRFGSFHAMSDAALLHILPAHLNPAQVRCALTVVIKRQLAQKNTFDADGWLRVGYAGAQAHMSETYINTGSEYLVCAGFCALGLPASDPFWANPYADWTSRKAWNNAEVPADHAIQK